jgi:hypothetical protein
MIHRFCIWLRICEVIRQSRGTSGVIDTAGAASVESMTPLVLPQRRQWHRWCSLSGVIDTAGATPAVSMTLLVPPQWIQLCKFGSKSHRTSIFNDTAGVTSAVSLTLLVLPQQCHWHRWCCLSGVIGTAGAI